ncbi:MAG TPA: hypothetical protein VJU77_13090 [Chthoniobacterales bacterium]|nr:hypothetical protein [Chthoniobacterales bacterium]
MKRLFLGAAAATLLVASAFGAKLVCKDTGKESAAKCCCTVKAGKFVCSFSKKTHDKCCCEAKS